jgi:hypothetical protein
MKQIERESKGEEADATDDEVSHILAFDVALPDFPRKMCFRLLTQMNRTTTLKIVSAQSMPLAAEPMLRPTTSLKTMQGAGAST